MNRWVLVEYGPGGAGDRRVIIEAGVLELTGEECANLNKHMVRTPCRLLPADWFAK